jgi:hypothetical protein
MTADSPLPNGLSFYKIGRILFFGFVVCVFSLNGVIRSIAGRLPWDKTKATLFALATIPDGVYRVVPGGRYFLLELLVRWTLISLAVFASLLLLNSIRHMTVNIFVSGAGGLLIGLFVLTWVSLAILLLTLLLICVRWLFSMLYWVFTAIMGFLLWAPVFYTLVVLVVIVVAVALFAYLRNFSLQQILAWLRQLFELFTARLLLTLLGLAVAVAVFWFVIIPLWLAYVVPILALIGAWLKEYIAPIIAWILSALLVLILALIVLAAIVFTLALLGVQLIDQLASARVCGRDIYGAFASGFSIGASAGLMLLVCSANAEYRAVVNAAWASTSPFFASADIPGAVYALMPASQEVLLQTLFVKASPPIFDSALIAITLFVANCSLLMGLFSGVSVDPIQRLFTLERMPVLFKLMFGVVVAFALITLDSYASQDS